MKKNKIVNKIGILVLAVMLSILSSITVLASEPEEAELGPRQDISKNLTTGEITVNEIPANLNKNSSDVMEPFIPEGMKVDPTTREVIGPDNRYRITDTTAYPNSATGTDNEAQGEVTERTDSRFPLRHYSQQKRVSRVNAAVYDRP